MWKDETHTTGPKISYLFLSVEGWNTHNWAKDFLPLPRCGRMKHTPLGQRFLTSSSVWKDETHTTGLKISYLFLSVEGWNTHHWAKDFLPLPRCGRMKHTPLGQRFLTSSSVWKDETHTTGLKISYLFLGVEGWNTHHWAKDFFLHTGWAIWNIDYYCWPHKITLEKERYINR